jgi:Neuraminidase (sialidase)
MRLRGHIEWALTVGFVVMAARLYADEQFPVASIPGLELTRGETVELPCKRSSVFRFSDGRMCVTGGKDEEGKWFSYWSEDGKTWEKGPLGPPAQMVHDFGDGEILSIYSTTFPRPDGRFTAKQQRSTDNWKTYQEEEGIADIPLATSHSTDSSSRDPGMLMHHGIVELPSGELLATLYGHYKGDAIPADAYSTDLGMTKFRVVVVSSSDRGKTWSNPVSVAYETMLGALNEPDITGSKFTIVPAITQEGFGEPDLAIAPNGDVICVMRSGGASGEGVMKIFPTPLYMSRSSDGGKTWTPPMGIADRGCNPHVVTLENGVMVCAYARPGAWVVFSDDNGKTWKGHTQVDNGRKYCYLVAMGPDQFMVFRETPDDPSNTNLRGTYFTVRKQ